MVSKIEVEIELKSNAEMFWRNLKEFPTFFPKALPYMYQSFQVIEGDGKSVGSILVATLNPDLKLAVSSTKERIELVDEENKILSHSYLEGEILKYYKSFKPIVCVSSKGDGDGDGDGDGAVVKYSVEFEKENQETADPHLFMDSVVKLFQHLDHYLLNPS